MHRLLIRCGRMYLNRSELGSKTNGLTRHFSTPFHRTKQSQITDDLNDAPTYCENSKTRKLSATRFRSYLEETLSCSSKLAAEICSKCPEFSEKTLNDINQNMELLRMKGVTKSLILDLPWMLTLKNDTLCSRLRLLEDMKPENIEFQDFVPLLFLPEKKLTQIKKIAEREEEIIPGKHRIHYFSKLLGMEPYTFSILVSKRPYMLELPFADLDQRIKLMLKYKTPKQVAKSLTFVFRATNLLESRLAQAQQLDRSLNVDLSEKKWSLLIEKFNETNAILGGGSLAQYYADRLGLDIKKIETMLELHPKMRNPKLPLMSKKLNYLLNEAGINASDILQYPYILHSKLELIKKRVQELQSYGFQSDRIVSIAYYSSESYSKFMVNLKNERNTKGLCECRIKSILLLEN